VPQDSLPWAQVESETELTLTFDAAVYSLEALQRACYWLTERCYVYIETLPDEQIRARLVLKNSADSLRGLAGEFGNRVLDEKLRRQINAETQGIRDVIVAQAFAEADIEDSREADYNEDPEDIGRR